jgi:uncharacterized protein
MRLLPGGSRICGELPEGCVHCHRGGKMVLLVTGLCGACCFYCPLSEKKRGQDVVYANERFIKDPLDLEQLLDEAESIEALGSGITGGEPLLMLERVLGYIKVLKEQFGKRHHIHLYSALAATREQLEALAEAGLDEIRFHLDFEEWYPGLLAGGEEFRLSFDETLKNALDLGLDVGVEIPLIPAEPGPYLSLIHHLEGLGVMFLNLNELEYSATNFEELNQRGWTVKSDISSAVLGSEELADEILIRRELEREEKGQDLEMTVHFCSVSFKDGVQLRNRLIRQARHTAKPYEWITDDGTLLKGIMEFPPDSTREEMENAVELLLKQEPLPAGLYFLNTEKHRLETSMELIGDLAQLTLFSCFIIENYPSADELEVERTPAGSDAPIWHHGEDEEEF